MMNGKMRAAEGVVSIVYTRAEWRGLYTARDEAMSGHSQPCTDRQR